MTRLVDWELQKSNPRRSPRLINEMRLTTITLPLAEYVSKRNFSALINNCFVKNRGDVSWQGREAHMTRQQIKKSFTVTSSERFLGSNRMVDDSSRLKQESVISHHTTELDQQKQRDGGGSD